MLPESQPGTEHRPRIIIAKKYLVLDREISYHCNRDKMESKKSTGKLESMNKKLSSENVVHCRFLTELLRSC